MINKIVIGVRGLNAAQLVDKARFVEERMQGHTLFTDPTPKLSDIAAARQALEAASSIALDGGRTAIAIRRQRERELKQLLTQLAGYVVSVAGGDELAILESGFGVRRPSRPVGEIDAPTALQAFMSPHKGRVDLRWKPVRNALTYTVQVNSSAPGEAASWRTLDTVSKARYTATGLESGKVHWFRVRGFATAGHGPFCDPAESLAL